MKIRTGFVSNSSSSSFVVGFPRRPKSVDEVRKWLFGELASGTVTYYEQGMSTWDIAERVFNDIKEQKRPLNREQIIKEIGTGYFEGCPSYNYNDRPSDEVEKEFRKRFPGKDIFDDDVLKEPEAAILAEKYRKLQREEQDAYNKACENAVRDYADFTVLPKMEGKKVFRFSYADDGGESVMEHGDIFHRLPHARISHH